MTTDNMTTDNMNKFYQCCICECYSLKTIDFHWAPGGNDLCEDCKKKNKKNKSSSAFQKAIWTEEEMESNDYDEKDIWFNGKNSYQADIAFMERELQYHQNMARQLKEIMIEKKEIVKEKLQELKENKTLSKEQKEKKKRQIMNSVFVG